MSDNHTFGQKRQLSTRFYNENKCVEAIGCLTVSQDQILLETTEPTSFCEIIMKQNITNSLTNVSDDAYHFVLELDKHFHDRLSENFVKIYKGDIENQAMNEMTNDSFVGCLWFDLFSGLKVDFSQQVLESLFCEIKKEMLCTNKFIKDIAYHENVQKCPSLRNALAVPTN